MFFQRGVIVGFLSAFLLVILVLVNSLESTVGGSIIIEGAPTILSGALDDPPTTPFGVMSYLGDLLLVMGRLLLFRVEGVPMLFNTLIFYPIVIALTWMFVDTIWIG